MYQAAASCADHVMAKSLQLQPVHASGHGTLYDAFCVEQTWQRLLSMAI